MITNEMLTQAAAELAEAINASLPAPEECHHQFSSKFEKRMKRLIYRTNHPVQHRILRSVACILLVMLLGFSSVMAVSVEAREAVFGWIREQYESFYAYYFDGQPRDEEPLSYSPGWMPDGFEYATTLEIAGGEVYIFTNANSAIVQFSYSTTPDNFCFYVETVDYEHRTVYVNGLVGDLYIPYDDSLSSELLWRDSTGNTIFSVSAPIEKELLIKIAEQIEK